MNAAGINGQKDNGQ